VVADRTRLEEVTGIVGRIAGVEPTVDVGARSVVAAASGGVASIAALAEALAEADVAVEDLGLAQPTLDDVFLTLTGAPPEDESANGGVPVTTISEEQR
jgi:ABC-2 type transport system ATP-binding protein